MKKAFLFLMMVLLSAGNMYSQTWCSDKYSMFVHFGLYSKFGGVWDGEPVRQGYSEQIQSFAGIFSDWYAATAYEFDPVGFDAGAIADLAVKGGMRSVVFTTKHHDGFCMFDTKTTSYNSVSMTPSGRDYVREMSEACASKGLRFGLYFSLIDWNYPHAYPISSHNADFVTPEHHEFNKAQVRELLTSYGPVSELWFDMGSLEPWQSRELYDLVKSLQPDCMVSGRLGNDVYDFAVMADNKLPQTALQAPWQSAVSMFPETWSYRSWQERGEVEDKVAEKLRTLIDVVSRGGNFLLNIGPDSDGSIVPFESEVIKTIGRWLEKNGEAIYGVEASPYRTGFEWGNITRKGNALYLLLTGKCPDSQVIVLPGSKRKVRVTPEMFDPVDVKVIRVEYESGLSDMVEDVLPSGSVLTWKNATHEYSYSCFDYYSNYRSVVGYDWNVDLRRPASSVEILYTSEEIGRRISLRVGDEEMELMLDDSCPVELSSVADISGAAFGRMRGGTFDPEMDMKRVPEWKTPEGDYVEVPSTGFANYLYKADVVSDAHSLALFDVCSGNGAELQVGGKTMMKHLNPYRTERRTEKVLIELCEPEIEVFLRSYNRFENRACAGFRLSDEQKAYRMTVDLPDTVKGSKVSVSLKAADRESPHTDCGLHNLRISLLR